MANNTNRQSESDAIIVGGRTSMSEEITVRLHRTADLTEAAALWSLGHPLHGIEVNDGFGNMQAVAWWREGNRLEAASDPRGEGEAVVLAPIAHE